MRALTLILAALMLATVLPTPAAAVTPPFGTVYFNKWYSFDVPPPPADPRYYSELTFTVHADSKKICYERHFYDGYEASNFKITIRDGMGRVVLTENGFTVGHPLNEFNLPGGIVVEDTYSYSTIEPLKPDYKPGTWKITFEGMGDNGFVRIRLYEIATANQCGTLPPQ